MASEELELRQQIAEAKAEEKTYEQFDEEQVIDGMNDYLKNVPTKLTSIPILSDAQPIGQSTPKVPSVKFQSSAIVSIISTTTSVNTSISVSASSMNPTAQPSDPRNLPIKEEEIEKDNEIPPDTELYHDDKKGCMYVYGKDSSLLPDQDHINIQRKQAELSKIIVAQQTRSLSPSHKPPMFSGDVISYPPFTAAFEVLTESKVDNPSECLYFLDHYTNRKAKELIKSCLWRLKIRTKWLDDFCRNTYKIASAYITKPSSWPTVKPNNGTGLQEFYIALEQAGNAIIAMHYMNDLSIANVLRQLWEKLPRYLGSKWTERVGKIRSNKGQAANFNIFCQFESEQADLATDPVYSAEGISRPKDTVDEYRKSD